MEETGRKINEYDKSNVWPAGVLTTLGVQRLDVTVWSMSELGMLGD